MLFSVAVVVVVARLELGQELAGILPAPEPVDVSHRKTSTQEKQTKLCKVNVFVYHLIQNKVGRLSCFSLASTLYDGR